MLKTELEDRLYSHPNFNVDRLAQIADGKALTKSILWQYLCELEAWKPLEAVQSENSDWYLVASSSELGTWHRTSAAHQTCDCQRYGQQSKPCCHLSAVMAQEEGQWIERAESYGFTVHIEDGDYQITDRVTGKHVGELCFFSSNYHALPWLLLEDRNQLAMNFKGADDAIEYLAAVASLGWQLANCQK